MSARNTTTRWGYVSQAFHWIIFLLIAGAWLAIQVRENFPKHSPEEMQWLLFHKSLGLTVFFLVWFRLGWRLANPTPKALVVAPWQNLIAQLTHWGLYALMVLLPVSGILMTAYGGKPVAWFGLFELPISLPKDKALSHQFHFLHTDVFWPLLLALLGLHIAAAAWHHMIVKDATLRRMLPGTKV